MRRVLLGVLGLVASACAATPAARVLPTDLGPLKQSGVCAIDSAPKEDLRMIPPEVYMRTYLQLFGGLLPLDAQKAAKGKDGGQLFDNWDAYVSALGFPDHRTDIPRQTQTNALMMATFERLGVALCDRSVEHDLKSKPPLPLKERVVFAFDLPRAALDANAFASRFDVLHRTFLGYPSALAPPSRAARFLQLYRDVAAMHKSADPKSRFSPDEAAWAAVCYGLVRHPEFQLY